MTTTEIRDGIEVVYIGPDEETPWEFLDWLHQRHHAIGFDVETGGSNPLDHFAPDFHVRMVSFAGTKQAWVLHGDRIADITAALNSKHVFVAHNATFDVLAVKKTYGMAPRAVIDTFLLALMVYPPAGSPEDVHLDDIADDDDADSPVLAADERHGLKPLSAMTGSRALVTAEADLMARFAEFLGPRPRGSEKAAEVKEWMGRGYATLPVEDPAYWVYNGLDGVFCLRVLRWLLAQWEGDPADIRRLLEQESHLGLMLAGVTWRGLRVDRNALSQVFFGATKAQTAMLPGFVELGVENPDSTKQVGPAFEELGVVNPVISEAGQLSTDKKRGLPRLREPDQPDEVRRLADLLVEWRGHKALRMKTREVDRIAVRSVDGRVHPSVNALKARTGRMSISNPALQNLPKKDQRIRAVFLAEEGHMLVGADFSQVEYRVAAALSRDPAMTAVFRAGVDLHDYTAEKLFGPEFTDAQRSIAKTVGFATLYGAGPKRIAATLNQPIEFCREVIDNFFEAYPGLRDYIAQTQSDTEIVSLSGRRTAIDPDKAYASTNYYIQGAARDLFADALLRLRLAGWGDSLWLVIHDEIILQVPDAQIDAAKAALTEAMTCTFRGIPITADPQVFGRRWGQLPADKPRGNGAEANDNSERKAA